jgi:hypothetical protein
LLDDVVAVDFDDVDIVSSVEAGEEQRRQALQVEVLLRVALGCPLKKTRRLVVGGLGLCLCVAVV